MQDKYILLFDGVCNLCNGVINFIIDRDKKQKFVFASLQSKQGQYFLNQFGLSEKEFKTMVLIKNNNLYLKSNAALEISRHLSGPWPLMYIFKIIPKLLRDIVYTIISVNRYRWFGKQTQCKLPTPSLKARFLEEAVFEQ